MNEIIKNTATDLLEVVARILLAEVVALDTGEMHPPDLRPLLDLKARVDRLAKDIQNA